MPKWEFLCVECLEFALFWCLRESKSLWYSNTCRLHSFTILVYYSHKRIILELKGLNNYFKLTCESHFYVNIARDWVYSLNILSLYYIHLKSPISSIASFSFHFSLSIILTSLQRCMSLILLIFNISFLYHLIFLLETIFMI